MKNIKKLSVSAMVGMVALLTACGFWGQVGETELSFSATQKETKSEKTDRPNVVYIVIDDMGFSD